MTDEQTWNEFIIANSSPASFLQSSQWGDFQEALGNKVYRVREDELQALVIVKKLPLGRTYLEIPKGPIVFSLLPSPGEGRGGSAEGGRERSSWILFINKLKKIGKKEKAVLARINPPYPSLQLSAYSFQRPEILLRQTEPEDTILVDLSKSEDELLANMHEKSRYNIRLAVKKGIKVRIATQDKQAFENFLDLLEETTKRDKITSWPRERFWKFREKFMNTDFRMQNGEFPSPSLPRRASPGLWRGEGLRERSNQSQSNELRPRAELLVGECQGQILACAIVVLFGDAGTYLYAASSAENRPANTPSLVLWEAIKLAKLRGKRWYDMWGIAPAGAGEGHPWAGITRFKTRYVKVGVTGKETRNIGPQDLILDKFFYNVFKLAKKFHP